MDYEPDKQDAIFNQSRQSALPNATAILVLGIISIVSCFCYGVPGTICSIIALVLSSQDMKRYHATPHYYTKGSLENLKAGKICAIIGLILSLLVILFAVAIIFTAVNMPEYFDQFKKIK